MPWSDYLALLALVTAMSFTPGPNTLLATAMAANRGLRPALAFAASVPLGWCSLLLACALGLGAVIDAEPALRGAVKWGGLAYLLWLATQLWQTRTLGEANPARLNVGFWQGAALQWVNIKAWMSALLVAAGWVAPGPLAERLGLVLPTLALYGFASNACYAVVGATLRPWLQQGQRLRWFNRSMAGVLLLTTAWMAHSA